MNATLTDPTTADAALQVMNRLSADDRAKVLGVMLDEFLVTNREKCIVEVPMTCGGGRGYLVTPKGSAAFFEKYVPILTDTERERLLDIAENPGRLYTFDEIMASWDAGDESEVR